jgi:hypothetical protein
MHQVEGHNSDFAASVCKLVHEYTDRSQELQKVCSLASLGEVNEDVMEQVLSQFPRFTGTEVQIMTRVASQTRKAAEEIEADLVDSVSRYSVCLLY